MKKEFWFIVGSQDLYGEEVLRTVATRAQEMATELSKALPYPLVYKVTVFVNKNIQTYNRTLDHELQNPITQEYYRSLLKGGCNAKSDNREENH